MVVLLLLCTILVGIAVWLFLKESGALSGALGGAGAPLEEPARDPEEERAEQILAAAMAAEEEANIERRIEQLQAAKAPPEIERLDALADEFEKDPTKWDLLIAVGDIYRKGAYPRFLPDEELASRIFKIAAMCPDGKVAGMGQAKYIEARTDTINDIDKAGNMLPQVQGIRVCEAAEGAIQSTPWHLFEKPKQLKAPEQPVAAPLRDFPDFEEVFWGTRNDAPADTAVPAYRIDSQNVHDHGVSAVTSFNIENLKKNVDINKLGGGNDDIRAAILDTKTDERTKADAMHVLDKLGDYRHSTFGTTEKEALQMVWSRIKSQDDATLRENLKETLAKQLASAVENGHVVCSSGKITRIMGTLDGVSNEAARPMWAVREELANLAAKSRDKATESYGDTPEAGRRAQEAFAAEVKAEYIDKLGMSKKIVEPLIDEYSMGF